MSHLNLMVPAAAPAIKVRPSSDDDVPAMLAIYRHHIAHGVGDLGAYELSRFDEEDLKRRRRTMRKHRLPHLVAEIDGGIAGYVYAVPFRKRPVYRYTVKHSIYVHPGFQHRGVGKALMSDLIEACAEAGYRQLVGYIDSGNAQSRKLHQALGFVDVGTLSAVAYRFGRWTDTVMVQRALGPGDRVPPDGDSPGSSEGLNR